MQLLYVPVLLQLIQSILMANQAHEFVACVQRPETLYGEDHSVSLQVLFRELKNVKQEHGGCAKSAHSFRSVASPLYQI
jgi:hypothetical protein